MPPKRRAPNLVPTFTSALDLTALTGHTASGRGRVGPTMMTPMTPPPDDLILPFSDNTKFSVTQTGVTFMRPEQVVGTQQGGVRKGVCDAPSNSRDNGSSSSARPTPTTQTASSSDCMGLRELQKDGGSWLLLKTHWNDKAGEGLSLRGEDFLNSLKGGHHYSGRDYLAKGSQGSVWLFQDFVFKRVAVSKPHSLTPHDVLPLCAEVGYALRVAYLQGINAEVARDLLPIHGVWYLKESLATSEPALYLAMDPHGMSLEDYQIGYMKVLPNSKVSMSVLFWDPDIDTPPPQPGGGPPGIGDVLLPHSHSSYDLLPPSSTNLTANTTRTGGSNTGVFSGGTTISESSGSPSSAKRLPTGAGGLFPPASFGSPAGSLTLPSTPSLTKLSSASSNPMKTQFPQHEFNDTTEVVVEEEEKWYGHHHYSDKQHNFSGTRDPAMELCSMKKSMSQATLSHQASENNLMDLEEREHNREYLDFKKGLRMSGFQEEVLCILAHDVLKSLASLHDLAFLMHNDIKAANILVSKDQRSFVLVDFGCALPVDERGIVAKEIVELVSHGNGEYKAPEAYEDFSKLVCDATQALSETTTAAIGVAGISGGSHSGGFSAAQSPIFKTIGSFDSVGSLQLMSDGSPVPRTPTSTTSRTSSTNVRAHSQARTAGDFTPSGGRSLYCTRSDVYSFAALLLEFRAGRKPKKVSLDSITIAYAAQQQQQDVVAGPRTIYVTVEKLVEKYEGLSHPSDRVQCIVQRYQPASGAASLRTSYSDVSQASPLNLVKQVVLRGVLDRGEGKSISLITDEGEMVPLLAKDGKTMSPGANLLNIEREANFGRVDVIDPEDVVDLNASELFKDFLLQALTLNQACRPSAKELLGHPFLEKAGTYRRHLQDYLRHLGEHKKKVEDTTILDWVTGGSQGMAFTRTPHLPGGLSYLEKAKRQKEGGGGTTPTSSSPH